jgi:predicted esterase YcpF (UPF0227 family)
MAGPDLGAAEQQATNWHAIIMFAIFVGLTLFITKWAARQTTSTQDFYTAGGGISGFQNGLAIAGDYMSAASFLGISALVFSSGFDGLLYSLGFMVGWPIVLFLVAERLRGWYQERNGEPVVVVGSSLGGFYATWFAEEFGCRAVLINPAVRPYDLLKDYVGPQRNYMTGEIQIVEPHFADDLRMLERKPMHPQRYWALLQTGDETLDFRDALDFYAGSRMSVLEGGDHSFVGYADWLPQIWEFACAVS